MNSPESTGKNQENTLARNLNNSVIFHLAAIILLLFTIHLIFLPPLTFIISDTGLRYLQVLNLIENQWQSLAINYELRFLDPELRFAPYYAAFNLVNGDILLSISPYLPILASFLYFLIGETGLMVVPVIGGVLTAFAVYKLGQLTGQQYPRWLLWAVVFATPIAFYSLELWDHTLATALITWAVYFTARGMIDGQWKAVLLGGMMAGLSLGQRPEAYPMCLAMGIALFLVSWQDWPRVLAWGIGGLLGALPIWVSQQIWVGHPLGMAVAPNLLDYGRLPTYASHEIGRQIGFGSSKTKIMTELLVHIEAGQLLTLVAAVLICLGFVGFWLGIRAEKWQSPRWLFVSFGLAETGYLIYGIFSITAGALVNGLLSVLPAVILAFIPLHQGSWQGHAMGQRDASISNFVIYRFIYYSTLLFIILMVVFWPAFGGPQWGARYLLLVYPLLFWLAWTVHFSFRAKLTDSLRDSWKVIGVGLLIMSILLQAIGIATLTARRQGDQIAREQVEKLPASVIITNAPNWPSTMAGLEDKPFLFVPSTESLETVLPRLYDADLVQIGIIPLEAIPLDIPEKSGDVYLCPQEQFIFHLQGSECES